MRSGEREVKYDPDGRLLAEYDRALGAWVPWDEREKVWRRPGEEWCAPGDRE